MFKKIPSGLITWTIIAFIYFGCFGFLSVYEFGDWKFRGFAQDFLAVLLGAGAIGIITAIILAFQSNLESGREKNTEVFKQKMELFKNIIQQMEKIFNDGKITEEEKEEMFFYMLKLKLIANQDTIKNYIDTFHEITQTENVTDEDRVQLWAFIGSCRKDLDILKNVDLVELKKEEEFEKQEIAGMEFKKWQKTNYEDWEKYKEVLEKRNLNSSLINLIDTIIRIVDKEKPKHKKKFTKTGIYFYTQFDRVKDNNFLSIVPQTKSINLSLSKSEEERVPNKAARFCDDKEKFKNSKRYYIKLKKKIESQEDKDDITYIINKSYEEVKGVIKNA